MLMSDPITLSSGGLEAWNNVVRSQECGEGAESNEGTFSGFRPENRSTAAEESSILQPLSWALPCHLTHLQSSDKHQCEINQGFGRQEQDMEQGRKRARMD
ncbi:hypothetical protein JOB18_023874 [Solea senegalensis]|uniref:Uncharacterized protein n=1 Tax=Solea senegalensis TaxID=28829 RepID=A0AAV6RI91_SOLSE|nr:hypothetical protein JOB18_023874 [Solea senegalensis]